MVDGSAGTVGGNGLARLRHARRRMAGMAGDEADGGCGDQRTAREEQPTLGHARTPWLMREAARGWAAIIMSGKQKSRMDILRRADLVGRRRSSVG